MIFSFHKFGEWWSKRHERREDRKWARRKTKTVFAWFPVRLAHPLSNEQRYIRGNTLTWKWAWLRPVRKIHVRMSKHVDSPIDVWVVIYKLGKFGRNRNEL